MDKDKLIQRQKEITKKLGAKPEAGRGRMSWKHRKKLNEELREINQKLRAFPDYKSLLRPRKRRKKKKADDRHVERLSAALDKRDVGQSTDPDKRTPRKPKSPALDREGYAKVKELIEKHHELQARLEAPGDKDMRRYLREELAATENLIQEYEPYLKGYKVIRKKSRSKKGSGQWIHFWQGGTPQ